MKRFYTLLGAACLTAAAASTASAVPFECWHGAPRPQGIAPAQDIASRAIMRAPKLGDSKWDNTDGHDLREVRTDGQLEVLVILVDFADVKFTVGGDDPRQMVDDMLNLPGFSQAGATGSARDFYHDTSCGQFNPVFKVYGPVQLDKKEVDYVKTDEKYTDPVSGKQFDVYPAGRMVEEAIHKIDADVNFKDFDTNGDGMVDFVYIFHAGKGATTGGNVNTTIWPHAFTLTSAIGAPVNLDGVDINRYATSSELGRNNRLSGIGTFCHEFGHVLGLPDLYDTGHNTGTGSECFTPGTFDTMDGGNYNNDEHTPAHFSGYERYALEWMKPEELTGSGSLTVLPLGARNLAYKVSTSNPQEYFILESRNRQGWDAPLEAAGLAVWHIDFSEAVWRDNAPNNVASHQRIDLVEADDAKDTATRPGDLFPGSESICEFTAQVSPAFVDWNGKPTPIELQSIVRHPDGSVDVTVTSQSSDTLEGDAMGSPAPSFKSITADSALLEWDPVEGACSYAVCVYPLAAFDGSEISAFHQDWYFKPCDSASAFVEGLAPATPYGVTVYALSKANARRQKEPLCFTTHASDPLATATRLASADTDKGVLLSWHEVAGASDYVLSVGHAAHGAEAGELAYDFPSSKLSDGWSGNGKFETRAANCGAAAPSYRFNTNGAYLQTPRLDQDIKSVDFWAKKRFDEYCVIDFFDVKADGSLCHIGRLADFSSASSFELPVGVKQLRMVYTMWASGLDLYADDFRLTLSDGVAFNALDAYDGLAVAAPSTAIEDLDPTAQYAAYVIPRVDGKAGVASDLHFFTAPNAGSGIHDVAADTDARFSVRGDEVICSDPDLRFCVYDSLGRCVAKGVKGSAPLSSKGIFVISAQGKAVKIAR